MTGTKTISSFCLGKAWLELLWAPSSQTKTYGVGSTVGEKSRSQVEHIQAAQSQEGVQEACDTVHSDVSKEEITNGTESGMSIS